MKKVKKLVLNRSNVSNLTPNEMGELKGGDMTLYGSGTNTCTFLCNIASISPSCGGGGGGGTNACPSTDILGDCATIDYEVSTCEYC